MPFNVYAAVIVTGVLTLTLPAVSCPDAEMLAGAPEFRLHDGVTVEDVPSLKIAVAIYWPFPFFGTLAGPEMESPVNCAFTEATVKLKSFDS